MSEPWDIEVLQDSRTVCAGRFSGRVELGRQSDPSEPVGTRRFLEDQQIWRLIIADRDEDSVSRHHARLSPLKPNLARVENLSSKVAILLPDGLRIEPNHAADLELPILLELGRRQVRIASALDEPTTLRSLSEATLPPRSFSGPIQLPEKVDEAEEFELDRILHWLQGTLNVLQSAAAASDFFDKAADALVNAVGLDSGRVLLRDGDTWQVVASCSSAGTEIPERPPSRTVLDHVRNHKRTFYLYPDDLSTISGLGGGLEAIVAAPILDETGQVLGLLYGDRHRGKNPGDPPSIGRIEANLVELLASSVAAGLARIESSRAAAAARVQLEQFFTPDLAHELAEKPQLLEGQDAEITVLFCDIRGFSRISERLGPAWTVNWINNVMGTLSDCVLDYRGVLVDYIGDMIMAMWGAPKEQPDHPTLACKAAQAMIGLLPELNNRWEPTLGEPMELGIGLNTGIARVGNIGSHRKFKYGPLGNTVNIASRVEGLNRPFKTRLLLSEATHARLDHAFDSRRLGLVKVNNIVEPVEIYELSTHSPPNWEKLKHDYESALTNFEAGTFLEAARTLGALLPQFPDDGPSLVLMSRVVNSMVDPLSFSRVFLSPSLSK